MFSFSAASFPVVDVSFIEQLSSPPLSFNVLLPEHHHRFMYLEPSDLFKLNAPCRSINLLASAGYFINGERTETRYFHVCNSNMECSNSQHIKNRPDH